MNQTNAASESTQSSMVNTTKRRVIAFALVSVCVGVVWFFTPNPAPPPSITVLPPDYSVPAPPLPVPDRWIPMTWGWLWRLRYAILGKPATVDIETMVVRFGASGETLLLELLNDRVRLSSSNGVRGWILPEAELKGISQRIAQERDCSFVVGRMSLGAGVLATMSMTTAPQVTGLPAPAGNVWNCAVRPNGDSVELTSSYTSWEAVTNAASRASEAKETISLRTNLTLAAKMRVPLAHGVFLYDTNRSDGHGRGIGLLVQPTVK